jgi:hypothetical protein
MTFSSWLSETATAQWISGSASVWAYPSILTVHTLSMRTVAGLNYIIGLRIFSVGRQLSLALLEKLYRLIWFGIWFSALSGMALFAAGAQKVFVRESK